VLIIKSYINATLQFCFAHTWTGWTVHRFGDRVTRGFPWIIGSHLDPITLKTKAAFRGIVDDVRMYSGIRSQEEIRQSILGLDASNYLVQLPTEFAAKSRCGYNASGGYRNCSDTIDMS